MYVLKQAARLANDKLRDHLASFGYYPDPHAPSIWKHNTRSIIFCLYVDDFGVKYFQKDDVTHLTNALQKVLKVYINYAGKEYFGFKLQ